MINRAISHEHIFGICRMGGTNCSLPINQSTTDQDCQFPAATGLNGLMAKVNFDGGGFSMDDPIGFQLPALQPIVVAILAFAFGVIATFRARRNQPVK